MVILVTEDALSRDSKFRTANLFVYPNIPVSFGQQGLLVSVISSNWCNPNRGRSGTVISLFPPQEYHLG
jgi:hypothetical protein